jgi:MFS transporter, putative metabolite:H+ symporter
VTVIGIFGAVVGGMTAELVTWRMNYIIGGSMGLILLFMRMSVKESGIYLHAKQTIQDTEGSISRGNFFALFTHWKLFKKYLNCIFIAIPTWYMVGILI